MPRPTAKGKRKYVSTIQPYTGPPGRKYQQVQEQQGVKVGRRYRVGGKLLQVMNISRYGDDPWGARVWYEGRPDHVSIPLQDIVKALHTRAHHPVQMCYAVGPGPLRRLKANPKKFVLYARHRRTGEWLHYVHTPGGLKKFVRSSPKPTYFDTEAAADAEARELKRQYASKLRDYELIPF